MNQIDNTRDNFIREANGKKLICFGAGKILEQIKGFLEAERLEIARLIDNHWDKFPEMGEGIAVESPAVLEECSGEEYFILISTKNFAKEIRAQIEKEQPDKFRIFQWPLETGAYREFDDRMWWERCYKPCELLYRTIASAMEEGDGERYLADKMKQLSDRSKIIIPRLPIMITTRCTLRCRECSNLMPYYQKPQDYDADAVISWIHNLCSAVDEIICLELVGGEPFLYRDLAKVLRRVLDEPKIQHIEFTTNGSVMPEDEVLPLLTDEKVEVMISSYPSVIDPVKVAEGLRQSGIRYSLKENMRWSKTGKLASRNRTVEELQSQYLNCGPAKMCRTILNGKLYVCSKAASLMELGYAKNLETVDLTDTDGLRDRIEALLRITYSKACNYCDMGSREEEIIEAAEQLNKT